MRRMVSSNSSIVESFDFDFNAGITLFRLLTAVEAVAAAVEVEGLDLEVTVMAVVGREVDSLGATVGLVCQHTPQHNSTSESAFTSRPEREREWRCGVITAGVNRGLEAYLKAEGFSTL